MGIYEKINKSFGKQFYFREFDKKYISIPDELATIEYLMQLHKNILFDIKMNKRDVVIDSQEQVDYFLESLQRNKCPISSDKFTIPLIVYTVTFTTPGDSRYEMELELLISNGVIPRKLTK